MTSSLSAPRFPSPFVCWALGSFLVYPQSPSLGNLDFTKSTNNSKVLPGFFYLLHM